jgi:hypothetical protein
MEETLWKNNLNFVKDEPMIYVNFIITGIIVSAKNKKGIITFLPPLVWVISTLLSIADIT